FAHLFYLTMRRLMNSTFFPYTTLFRSMPRVGKTESIVAGSVSANKKWLFVSSTLLKQTVRNQLIEGEYGEDYIYIIDGVVSQQRASEKHWQLIREIMRIPAT